MGSLKYSGRISAPAVVKRFSFERQGGSLETRVCAGGLVVHDAFVPVGNGQMSFSDYAVCIVSDPVTGSANWHGDRIPRTTLPPGGVTFIPATSHLEGECEGPYRVTMMMLGPSVFEAAAAERVNFDKALMRYALLSDPVTGNLAQTLAHISQSDDYRAWPLLVESVVTSLAASVVAQLSPDPAALIHLSRHGLGQTRKQRVMQYIEDNLSRQITLEELAGVAAVSKFHFARSFRKEFGATPLQYISRRRIEEAKKLMRSTDHSLAEIAYICGFASHSHMTTVFKQMLGVSPRQFRMGIAA